MDNLALSIVLVSYNSRKDLAECLASIYDSPGRESFEVVLVDNGSTDGGPEAAERLYPHVRILHAGRNAGYTGGNNIGYRNSTGRHVLFLNPDTRVCGNALDILVERVDRDGACGAIGPHVLNQDGSLQRSCYRAETLPTVLSSVLFLDYLPFWERLTGIKTRYAPAEYEREMAVDVVSGCCLLVPRRVLDEVGAFDEEYWMYGEEADLCERIRARGYRVVYTPAATVVHLGGATTQDHSMQWRLLVERNRRLFFAKHRGKLSLAVFRAAMFVDTIRRIASGALQLLWSRGAGPNRVKTARAVGVLLWQLGLMRNALP